MSDEEWPRPLFSTYELSAGFMLAGFTFAAAACLLLIVFGSPWDLILILLAMLCFIAGSVAIRCPQCGKSLLWRFVELPVGEWGIWMKGIWPEKTCSRCGERLDLY